jgi:transglutaminase-like putative cysteine protease
VFSPLTPTGVSQETSVSLIGAGAYLNAIQRRGDGPYTVNALVPVAGEEPGQLSQSALQAAGTEYPADISIYLQVPEGAIPAGGKAEELLRSLKASSPSMNPFVFAQYLTTRFRVNNDLFAYQSNIQDRIIKDCNGISSVECFARIRVGFCQYYATTMAIFLRASGIPARVVNGFLPGERTKAGVETITNSQSHEWVEVYFPGYGWVMFDPTGGDLARAAPLPSGKPVPSGSARPSAAILPFPSFPDDRDRTPNVSGFGNGGPVATAGPFIAIAVLLAIIIIALGFVAWQRGPRRGTTADEAYRTVTRIASRFGFAPRPTQTVYEFAGTLGEVLPNARPELETVARAKVETAYGRTVLESDRLQSLREAERRLRVSLLSLAFRRRERRRRH